MTPNQSTSDHHATHTCLRRTQNGTHTHSWTTKIAKAPISCRPSSDDTQSTSYRVNIKLRRA
ncbi:hypothetical protein BDP81DRAFT_436757 [Colletotrichum phormii]|uniref:Uncharacterized protein n=1 Tax=Colletotrichum phormii TaxID=359342 RepID=A0AAI9ZKG8_9PEZI|nr:uncharacterized protein BDP81DRAFT_436757 [Colletotrichum phormii]KAK1624924.1 hypothetical protein BDP81DRAFT_436757 [Colletotrichum phormii]